jgi:uroporphyrin-III C-methyltransferase
MSSNEAHERMTDPTPLPAPAAEPQPARSRPPYWIAWLALAVLVVVAATWLAQNRFARFERDLVRRVQAVEVKEQQRDEQVRLSQDLLRDAQGKVSVLEAKLSDSVGQLAQLRQLYDEMARSRGDLMLADVESSIMIAAQQLQLSGNVQGALLAMQDAEQLLARSDQPALIGLRRIVARDAERLKEVPQADLPAAVARLDAVLAAIDQMPLLADVSAAEPAAPARPAAPPKPAEETGFLGLSNRMARTGQQGWDAFVTELRQLVRVQRVDQPESLLLAPDQRYFARENLRLTLLNARLNLLARNEALLRSDLGRAVQFVERYFDGQNRTVGSALVTLRQLQSARLTVELPSLSESVRAVRAARAASDTAKR